MRHAIATKPPHKCESCHGRPGTLYIDTFLCQWCRTRPTKEAR